MTVSLAGPLPALAPRSNGTDKADGKTGADDGFRDVLAGTPAKKKPAAIPDGDERMRPTWMVGGQPASTPAENGRLIPAIRFGLAGDIPADRTAETLPATDPLDEPASGEDGKERDADGALALLGEMVGRDTPRASGNSGVVSTAKAPSNETTAGDQPEATDEVATSPAVPAEAARAAGATATTSEIARVSTTTGVIWQAAGERSVQQREPGRIAADRGPTAPGRMPSIPTGAAGTSSASLPAGDVTVTEMEQAKEAAPAGTRNDAARNDLRPGDMTAAAKGRQGQAQPADSLAGRVNVVGFSSSLAPSPAIQQALGTTSAGVVASIQSDPAWQAAAQEFVAAGSRQHAAGSVQSLRIQLNPAELGMVTARLTAHGQQLSVEIQTESPDAHRKLTTDSDAILKALRAIGYDVDKVTIQQAPASINAANAQAGSAGRDAFQPNQQAQGDGGARGQGERGSASGSGEGNAHGPAETAADRTRGDIYI